MTVNKLRGAAACLCVLSQIFTWIDPIHLAWVDVGWIEIPHALRVQTTKIFSWIFVPEELLYTFLIKIPNWNLSENKCLLSQT